MQTNTASQVPFLSVRNRRLTTIVAALVGLGLLSFLIQLAGSHPERAWQAYLINFLLWSGIAQGGLLFSAVMHLTKARWSGPLSNLAEAFAGFFPLSLLLFAGLLLGQTHVFPWLQADLHGKEVWLNVPFLMSRDGLALLILYGLGFAYLRQALRLKANPDISGGFLRFILAGSAPPDASAAAKIQNRKSIFSALYILAFALVLSLIGYDLVMAMDPHWISTLFGGYTFVKAFYVGLGGLIILAAVHYLTMGDATGLKPEHFHDIGKLFFAFCLLWGDFFYVHLVVIWYGNISEETAYLIERLMLMPWQPLAWGVFTICFILPFLILLNRKIKTRLRFMIGLCSAVIVGIWLEHLLLIGPAMSHGTSALPLGIFDGFIFLGFLGLMALAVTYFLDQFPELTMIQKPASKG